MIETQINRRHLLQSTGIVIGFSLSGALRGTSVFAQDATPAPTASELPAFDPATRDISGETVDSWLSIDTDGHVTLFIGKVELGTGIKTALTQIVAEDLDVAFDAITTISADTAITPDQGTTAGSKTIQGARPTLVKVAAQARQILLTRAAETLGDDISTLSVVDGVVTGASSSVGYGELAIEPFNAPLDSSGTPKDPSRYTVSGTSVPRVDLLEKLTGGEAYVQDVRLEGMLHGRVIRPHSRPPDGLGYTIGSIDDTEAKAAPGVVAVVRNGNFVGVVAEREEQAIAAAALVKIDWQAGDPLPDEATYFDAILEMETDAVEITRNGDVDSALNLAVATAESTYHYPSQAHASMGPSCSVADVQGDSVVIYSPTQGVGGLQGAVAQLLGFDEANVRIIYREGAGCYGHNGADDVGADAALLSQAVGKPVRVQWMRQDEFAWEPKSPPMVSKLRGGVDADGNVIAWDYEVYTSTHNSRPGGKAGNLIAGQTIDPPAEVVELGQGGGDRNAQHNYSFPNNRITAKWLATAPLRPSALRSLGGLANGTANESFMDELCALAGADPVEFRLKHLVDPRAIAVIEAVAETAKWEKKSLRAPSATPVAATGPLTGRGLSFVRYESEYAYAAVIADVSVDPGTGIVSVPYIAVGHDCGIIINPDGLTNQIQGNVIQGVGRALHEVVTWNAEGVTSLDWSTYQIMTFAEIPQIDVAMIDHPEAPAWGAGEITICAVVAAVGNAIYDATGIRLYEVPFSPARVLAALNGA